MLASCLGKPSAVLDTKTVVRSCPLLHVPLFAFVGICYLLLVLTLLIAASETLHVVVRLNRPLGSTKNLFQSLGHGDLVNLDFGLE